MISASRRWLRRNRTNFAIGFGVVGVGYVAGQYIISRVTEARQRMSDDRVAKEKSYLRLPSSQAACADTFQPAAPLPAEPGRLHLHRPRPLPHCGREYRRSFTRRKDLKRAATEASRQARQRGRRIRCGTLRALIRDAKSDRRRREKSDKLPERELCARESDDRVEFGERGQWPAQGAQEQVAIMERAQGHM